MLKRLIPALLLGLVCAHARANTEISIAARMGEPQAIVLSGKTSSQQLVVTAKDGTKLWDATHKVTYQVKPAGIVICQPSGLVKPIKNGKGTITVQLSGAAPVSIHFEVSDTEKESAADFANEVIPILTRSSCNSGACHGKAGGRNGFRLSLLGYEPEKDFRYIVYENRGRRASPAAPDQSLLLQKATGEIPHEGGVRWEIGSESYNAIRRWIAQGLPYDPESPHKVERIELFPTGRTYQPKTSQQLVVTAIFTDGTRQDVTHMAQYEANQEDMAEVDENGHVEFKNLWGSTSVLVRFKEHVATFFGNITLGEMVNTPPAKNFIDEQVFKKLKLLGLPPSAPCDDPTFLRRVSLDVAGRLPTVDEIKSFLADKDLKKRSQAVERLLDDPGYAHNFANKWTSLLRNKRSRYDGARVTFAFYDWVHNAIKQNMPYDEFVKSIITASGESNANPSVLWYRSFKNDKDFVVEPKEKSEDFAQIFLGIRIACAQCHHHPFDQWSQKDYSALTAFFSGLNIKPGASKDELVLVRAKKQNQFNNTAPAALGGEELEISKYKDPRFSLANWISKNDNPYFAKSFVNRYWKQFFGRGLVDPIDDMRVTNPPSHPELLDQLAEHFVKNHFDMKSVIRLICNSQTYQFSSTPNKHNAGDQQNYSRFIPRRLPAEIFLDSINDVTEMHESFDNQETGTTRVLYLPDDQYNTRIPFLQTFGRPKMDSASDSARKTEATVNQSLAMINSSEILRRISYSGGRAARMAKSKDDINGQIDELFLQAFARYPRKDEKQRAVKYIQSKVDLAGKNTSLQANNKKEGIEDLLWALINTKEFMFNN